MTLIKPLISLFSALLITLGLPMPDLSTPDVKTVSTPIEITWDKETTRDYVKEQVAIIGWTGEEWTCLSRLIGKESAWNHEADNPRSSAYGLFQILKTPHDLEVPEQLDRGIAYIRHRYETPCKALEFWQEQDRKGTPWY